MLNKNYVECLGVVPIQLRAWFATQQQRKMDFTRSLNREKSLTLVFNKHYLQSSRVMTNTTTTTTIIIIINIIIYFTLI